MKNLHKIIALFAVIFIAGIYISIKHINTPLNSPQETVEIQKDSLKFNKLNNKTV
jgi:hypothetical protein